ncbi:ABC transporter substrate-binding protein [Curtobacterium flaccumfaciens]|uniref:ABC transporter substrate-binding protein n=1 Tax=Curtobacterium flaccumfaciens TaxID=2035 RepID=UPI001889E640|nr:ABC transporter substrate-binding protein [Curtobacterium flaccumfaciens]MBF4595609.1 ABC transporter substrate-binding protein [Curtobacterium flaccumfaciens]
MILPRLVRRSALALGSVAVLVALAACTSGTSSTSTGASDVLRVDDSTAPASLDPAAVCSIEDLGLLSDLYPTLTQYAVKSGGAQDAQTVDASKAVPDLAASWDTSSDGLTWTFHLNPDAKFASGNPITAPVVEWSWERALKLGSCGTSFVNGSNISKVTSITTPDDHTVVTKLSARDPDYLLALTSVGSGIVDQKLVEQHGTTADEQNTWLASHFAGGAAYKVDSYVAGTSLALSANDNYYGTAPLTKKVTVTFISDDASLLLRARNGSADVTLGLTKQSVASLKSDSKVKIIDNEAAAWQLIGLPNAVAPFDNATFREALTYATPQDELVSKVAYGYGKAFYGPLSRAFPAYDAASSAPRAYDIAKAKQLVKESGVTGTVKIDVYVRQGVNDQKQIATILQDSWKQLGVDLAVKQLSSAEYQKAVSAPEKKSAIIRFDGPSVLTPGWLLSYDATCGSAYNQSNYCNPKVDSTLQKALAATSDKQRQDYYDQITKLWIADSPRAIAYAQDYTAVLQKDVTNYSFAQNNTLFHLWAKSGK